MGLLLLSTRIHFDKGQAQCGSKTGCSPRASASSLLTCTALFGGDEDEAELTNLDFVADFQYLRIARLAVDVGAIERSDVHDLELAILGAEFCVAAGDGDVIEEDVCFRVTAGGGGRLIKQ